MDIQTRLCTRSMFDSKMNGDAFLGNVTKKTSRYPATGANQKGDFEIHEVNKVWQPSVEHEFLKSSPTEGLDRLSNNNVMMSDGHHQGLVMMGDVFVNSFDLGLLRESDSSGDLSAASSPDSSLLDFDCLSGTPSAAGSLSDPGMTDTTRVVLLPNKNLKSILRPSPVGTPIGHGTTKHVPIMPTPRASTRQPASGKNQPVTDKERELLAQEGIQCPTEDDLRRIRRKIINRQSAQESRKRKREEVEQLNTSVRALTVENEQLKQRIGTMQQEMDIYKCKIKILESIVPSDVHATKFFDQFNSNASVQL